MSDETTTTADEVERRTRRWIEEAVIGLDFCPFAASVYYTGAVRIAVRTEATPIEAVDASLDEASTLLETPPEDIATTLSVFPSALSDFRTFLDVAETIRSALAETGAEGILQVATFHPDYQFAGTERDDVENFTNRSPFPTLHLLREAQVTEAVDDHPDPEGIPEANIERLEQMGRDEIRAIWREFC